MCKYALTSRFKTIRNNVLYVKQNLIKHHPVMGKKQKTLKL